MGRCCFLCLVTWEVQLARLGSDCYLRVYHDFLIASHSSPFSAYSSAYHLLLIFPFLLQVIGVVRGRAEHGPRALGHRSLLSAPSKGMKERMNALKVGEGGRGLICCHN